MEAHSQFTETEAPLVSPAPAKSEYISCLQCGGIRHEGVLRSHDHLTGLEFQVVRCEACGLHFTNPRPTSEAIGQFYAVNYQPHRRAARTERPLRSWYPFDWLKMPASPEVKPRLLDFGCGAGQFLAAMRRRGWDVTGLDASEEMVDTLREKLDLPALAGSLPHDFLEPNSFELITMWHALEHVHDPVRILREARQLLANGGQLVIAVPNFAGWQSQWFGIDWFGLELPRHLTHFSADTLRGVLEKAGLKVRAIRHARHSDWLRSSAMRAHGNGRSSLVSSALRFKRIADAASWLFTRGRHGDAILALAEGA